MDRDSSVGIATRHGLNGLRIEFRWGRDFPHQSRPVLGLTQPPVHWVPGLLPQGKAAGAWRWQPNPSRAEVKERVEQRGLQGMLQGKLYIYSLDGTKVARASRGLHRSTAYTKWLQFLPLSRTTDVTQFPQFCNSHALQLRNILRRTSAK